MLIPVIKMIYYNEIIFFRVIPIFAVAASVGTLVILIYEIGRKSPSVTPIHPVPTFKGLTLGFSSILFSLGGASTFPTIQNDMKNRDRFAHSVVIAFTCKYDRDIFVM